MIFLDLTSACHTPLHSGVKRMQRGLHSLMKSRSWYRPVCWQSVLRDYRSLTSRDMPNLEIQPARALDRKSIHDVPIPGLLKDWKYAWRDRRLQLGWPDAMQPGDMLIVPDLLWDNREVFFRKHAPNGVRKIGFFHDAFPLRFPAESGIDAFLCARAVRMLALFDHVICVSKEAEQDLHHFWHKSGCRPTKTSALHWPAPFHEERLPSLSNFRAKNVLCVARLESYKNHLRLLDACEELWKEGIEFSLTLIGCKSYANQTRRILRRIEQLQAEGHCLQWSVHVSDKELKNGYQNCSFTVYPSIMEGFGLPIIESLWHGRPVVCAGTGALGEVANGGGCEIVDVLDSVSIREGLRKLLCDEEHYGRLYQQSLDRPYKDWHAYWEEFTELLDVDCQVGKCFPTNE